MNFKGGVGQDDGSSAHLAQRLALKGYPSPGDRPLDPQCFSHGPSCMGFSLEFDLLDGGTLYDAIRYEDRFRSQTWNPRAPTYISRNLDLCFPGAFPRIAIGRSSNVTPRGARFSRAIRGLCCFMFTWSLGVAGGRSCSLSARPSFIGTVLRNWGFLRP